jgi:ABC-2 type transport system ATP-binding protein
MRPAIEIANVSKKFKERGKWFWALRDVSFDVKPGEIFGLLGPNGAGKTTLLNILVGILTPDAGSIRVLGADPIAAPAVLEQMNFISGQTRFHWALLAQDVLNFYAAAYGLQPKARKKRIARLVEFFDLRGILKRKFDVLSTGEKRRLVFAKALLNRPKLLLLDEPTLGLDPDMAIKLRKEIKRINKKLGITILLTSHYMHEVEQLADRIAFIYRGRIIDIGGVELVKMRKFARYDVILRVAKVFDRAFLRKAGFRVIGRELRTSLGYGESLSELLNLLAKRRYKLLDIHVKKPSLEDYFIKIVKARK